MTNKLKPPGLWTEGEDACVRRGVRMNRTTAEIASELNRPMASVEKRAEILKRMAKSR